jgi:hypothetical protein
MIAALNSVFGGLFAAVFYPFRSMNPWVGMSVVSLLTAVLMLVVFRYTSNQEGIRAIKSRIQAYLLELRLYKDSLSTQFATQGRLLACLPKYIGYSSVPVLVMIVPLVFMMIQIDDWFGYERLQPGDTAVVTVRLQDGLEPSHLEIAAEAPPGLAVDTPALRIDRDGEVDWRVRAVKEGVHDLVIRVGSERVTKQVVVGGRPLAPVSWARVGGGMFEELSHPGEPAIARTSQMKRIEVAYAGGRMSLLGWRVHWLVAFFVLSLVFGYLLKGLFKVEV